MLTPLTEPAVVGAVAGSLLTLLGVVVKHFFDARQFRNEKRLALYEELNRTAVLYATSIDNMCMNYSVYRKKLDFSGVNDEVLLARVELLAPWLVRRQWRAMVAAYDALVWEMTENLTPEDSLAEDDPMVIEGRRSINRLLRSTRTSWL